MFEMHICLLNNFLKIKNATGPISLMKDETRKLGMWRLVENRDELTSV